VGLKNAWYGKLSRTTVAGAEMKLVVHGSEAFLVGRVGPSGGRARVTYGTMHKTLSFRSDTTHNRVVLAHFHRARVCAAGKPRHCRNVRRSDKATLKVKSLGGGRVDVDALGFR
jgi:hypothetical protein